MKESTENKSLKVSSIILKSFLLYLLFILLGWIFIEVFFRIFFTRTTHALAFMIITSIFNYIIIILLVRFFTKKHLGEDILKSSIFFSNFTQGTIVWAGLAILLTIPSLYIAKFMAIQLPHDVIQFGGSTAMISLWRGSSNIFERIAITLFSGILSPIFDEIFLRGFILRFSLMRWGLLKSFLINMVLTLILYPYPLHLVSSLTIAFVTCLAFHQSKKLYKSIVFHSIYNLGSIWLGRFLPGI